MKATIQRIGGYLAGMVMPNIGAFIAWGLITALFIPTGWIPNEKYAALVGPMILYLLPILIGYTGGKLVHGQRGAVIGAVATMGVIVGSDIPMFLGAMIVGPLAAFVLKRFDDRFRHRVRTGFEMLIDNFSLGIIGGAMAVLGVWVIGPVINNVTDWLGDGVETLVDNHLIPLAAVIIEPAKVLFLNNAINHGVLGPLGRGGGRRAGQVDPVHARDEPRSGPRRPAGVHVLRPPPAAARPCPRPSSSSSSAASTRSTSRTS